MNKPIRNYVKIGIVHFMAYPAVIRGEGPVLETIQKIAEDDYFDLIEITTIKDSKIRKKVVELLKSSKLEVKFGAQPCLLLQKLDLNSLNEEERKGAIEEIKNRIDEAIELDATSLGILSGKYPGKEKEEDAKKLLVDSLKTLCEYANSRKENFPIVLEIFDKEVDKCCLIGSAQDALWVAEEVKKVFKNFGLMHDLSHLPLLKETPQEALEPIKEHLVHVHLGNCILDKSHPAYGDTHPHFGIKGGINDVEEVKEFLEVLMKIGYFKKLSPLSFEVKPLPNEVSQVVIANAKRVLDRAWIML